MKLLLQNVIERLKVNANLKISLFCPQEQEGTVTLCRPADTDSQGIHSKLMIQICMIYRMVVPDLALKKKSEPDKKFVDLYPLIFPLNTYVFFFIF